MLAVCGACALGFVVAGCYYWLAPPQSAEYLSVAQTRSYWFIDLWRWYELLGLAAPLAILAAFAKWVSAPARDALKAIAAAACVAGIAAIAVAMAFARESVTCYAIARLQPLRMFHVIYIVMILLLGGFVAERMLKARVWLSAALVMVCGGTMFFDQLETYPDSAHLEFPWSAPKNGWEEGFAWIRDHTPRSALFALDSNYITAAGEDSQNFRAIAERSTLPDYSKDGGVAAIAPELASRWAYGETVQAHLNDIPDWQRARRLTTAGIDWVVLSRNASTSFWCPYINQAMKVCAVPNVNRDHEPGLEVSRLGKTRDERPAFVQPK
jgi:hypothetical protein